MTNKFRAKKTIGINGQVFDSGKEATWAHNIEMLRRGGFIKNFQTQAPRFVISPKRQGKRELSYTADFYIERKDGTWIVADCKGYDEPLSKLKRRIVYDLYGVDVLINWEDVHRAIILGGRK